MPRQIHWTLQGKGGVGKSVVSAVLVQYLRGTGHKVKAVDTDPVNATLAGYKALEAERLVLIPPGRHDIQKAQFDPLMDQIMVSTEDFVIDNGASSFVALSDYLIRNEALAMISEAPAQVWLHTVVSGGQAMLDTLRGFQALVSQMPPEARIVVWLNAYFGPVVFQAADGFKEFTETNAYQSNRERVSGIVTMMGYGEGGELFGQDMQAMLQRRLTFAEAQQSPDFSMMAKRRLAKVRADLFDQLAAVLV